MDEMQVVGPPAKKARVMDWSKHALVPVAVKFLYIGPKYAGFASSRSFEFDFSTLNSDNVEGKATIPSVEDVLMPRLPKLRLTPVGSKTLMKYSRCGRTDRGVHALGQVISFECRQTISNQLLCQTLNRALPPHIRVHQAAQVSPQFHARFSCTSRTYVYLFTNPDGRYDVSRMAACAEKFRGDGVNFVLLQREPDVRESYCRDIYEARIIRLLDVTGEVYGFVLRGSSFLYNQVRCMMSLLFHLSNAQDPKIDGNTALKIMDDVLGGKDTVGIKTMAPAAPEQLILWDCGYEDSDLKSMALPAHQDVEPKICSPSTEVTRPLVVRDTQLVVSELKRMRDASLIESVVYDVMMRAVAATSDT